MKMTALFFIIQVTYLVPIVFSILTQSQNVVIALSDFDDVSEKYCEPENVSNEMMIAVEKCYQLSAIDFQGMNPYSECKAQIFTKSEKDDEIRNSLCTDDDLDETFEDCMDSAILGHDSFKKLFQDRLDCIKKALGDK